MKLKYLTEIANGFCAERVWEPPVYIDSGASAAVFSVKRRGDQKALKVYDPEFFEGDNALIEANRIALQDDLKGHNCANLVQVFESGEVKKYKTWYLLMEFCPWISLDKKLTTVPDEKVHHLLKQLVHAVQFLEKRGFVHRDIKPANIVVSDDFEQLKLLDFGVMRRIAHDEGSGTDGHKFIATAQYSPPEFLSRQEIIGEAGFGAINLYQVGAVLHDLITKTAIFAEEKATRNKFILFKAVTEKRPRVVSASVPPRLIALCLAALAKDPQIRAKSVSLDDFLSDADDLDVLRRRVARSGQVQAASVGPSLAVWRSKVRSWGKEAAQLEIDTLGAVTMEAQVLPAGHRWKLDFAAAQAPIFLDVLVAENVLTVHVLSAPDTECGPAIFTIGFDGPSLPEMGLVGALAAQYLFALDEALSS